MKRIALASFALLATTACATVPGGQRDNVNTRLGRTVNVDGVRVTPLKVLEDSRCPMEARCVWAGRVRLSVKVRHHGHDEVREIASDRPVSVGDGTLLLTGVLPPRSTQHEIAPREYRFSFRLERGL
ncbi:hypothetical protein [Novosphingobium sp.]|uniref:hypothetical protein n=1 Tax=Novosphingobium sp. TaxID=1874826 RepID=UPI0035B233A8